MEIQIEKDKLIILKELKKADSQTHPIPTSEFADIIYKKIKPKDFKTAYDILKENKLIDEIKPTAHNFQSSIFINSNGLLFLQKNDIMDKETAINLLIKFMRENIHLRSLNEIANPFKKQNPAFPINYRISEMLEMLWDFGVVEKTRSVKYENIYYYTLINTDENFHLDLSENLSQSNLPYTLTPLSDLVASKNEIHNTKHFHSYKEKEPKKNKIYFLELLKKTRIYTLSVLALIVIIVTICPFFGIHNFEELKAKCKPYLKQKLEHKAAPKGQ